MAVNLAWLAPLALAAAVKPRWGFYHFMLAYLPLVVGAIVTGGGRIADR
jgi:hypothetical protein